MAKALAPEEVQKIAALTRAGVAEKKIAAVLKIHRNSVYR